MMCKRSQVFFFRHACHILDIFWTLHRFVHQGARLFGAIVFHQIPSGEKGAPGDWVFWQNLGVDLLTWWLEANSIQFLHFPKAYSIRLNVSSGTKAGIQWKVLGLGQGKIVVDSKNKDDFPESGEISLILTDSYFITFCFVTVGWVFFLQRKTGVWDALVALQGTTIFTEVPATRPLDLGLRMNEAGSVVGTKLRQCHAMAMRPLFQAFAYSKRGFTTLQLLVDRYIIGWQNEVELTEDSICKQKRVRVKVVTEMPQSISEGPLFSKHFFFLAISQVGGHFQLFFSRAGCGVCTVLVHCKDTRRELLLQGGMRWAMGETVETQAKLAEHLRYVIQCEMGIKGYSFLLVSLGCARTVCFCVNLKRGCKHFKDVWVARLPAPKRQCFANACWGQGYRWILRSLADTERGSFRSIQFHGHKEFAEPRKQVIKPASPWWLHSGIDCIGVSSGFHCSLPLHPKEGHCLVVRRSPTKFVPLPIRQVLNELISEKETKVRESLRMLGVRSFAIISPLAANAWVFGSLSIACRKEGQRATHSTWETRLMVCDVRRYFCRSLCNFRHLGLILCSLVQNSKLENFLYLCSMRRSLRFSQAPVWRWSSFSFGCGACLSSLLNPVSINVDSWIWARVRCDAWWVMRTFWVWTLL